MSTTADAFEKGDDVVVHTNHRKQQESTGEVVDVLDVRADELVLFTNAFSQAITLDRYRGEGIPSARVAAIELPETDGVWLFATDALEHVDE